MGLFVFFKEIIYADMLYGYLKYNIYLKKLNLVFGGWGIRIYIVFRI